MTHWLSACNVLIVYLLGFGHWVRKIVSGTCVIDDFLQVSVLIWSHLSYTLFLTFRVICNQCLFRSLKKNCGYLVYNNFSVQSQLTIATWPKDKWIAEKKKKKSCSSLFIRAVSMRCFPFKVVLWASKMWELPPALSFSNNHLLFKKKKNNK